MLRKPQGIPKRMQVVDQNCYTNQASLRLSRLHLLYLPSGRIYPGILATCINTFRVSIYDDTVLHVCLIPIVLIMI